MNSDRILVTFHTTQLHFCTNIIKTSYASYVPILYCTVLQEGRHCDANKSRVAQRSLEKSQRLPIC
jgi:hypothetical protein